MNTAADSPIVAEVRERAIEISARFDHDLQRYALHLKEIERQHQDRVVNQITVIRVPRPAVSVKP